MNKVCNKTKQVLQLLTIIWNSKHMFAIMIYNSEKQWNNVLKSKKQNEKS